VAITDTAPRSVGDTNPDGQIKVLIADDHPLIIAGIRRTIEPLSDVVLVGEARSATELLELVQRRRPDIVLMDLRMPGMNGVEVIQRIRRDSPWAGVVVLSACDERPTIDRAVAAGASAYVLKSANTIDVAAVIRRVAGGEVVHPCLPEPNPAITPLGPRRSALTGRERLILEAVATGMTTAAISQELWVSEHTIKFHLTNIYRKLGVANRAGAIRFALEHGIG
jgi:DNA-binding NarL/FixJ family response regulator